MLKVLFLSIGAFALGVDAYVMAGLLPGIGATFAQPPSNVGQTVTAFTVFYAVSAPLLGALMAGKPARPVMVLALGIFTLSNAWSALSPSFAALLASRAIAGVGAGLYTPSAVAAAAAMVKPHQRGRALGLIIGGLAMGTALGVPLGLTLATHLGWRATLWLITGLGLVAATGIGLGFPNIPVASPPSLRQRLVILGDRRVAATIMVSFLGAVGSIGFYTYVALFLRATAEVTDVLPLLWAWSLGGLLGVYGIGMLLDRKSSPERLMVFLILGMAIPILTLLEAGSPPILVLGCFLIWGLAGWGAQTPQQHRLLALQPTNGGTAVALHSSAHYLGSAAGAALGGAVLAMGLPIADLPALAGAVLACTLLLQLLIVRNDFALR
jgi:predicted MFS family arabinose efflux permease